MCNTHGPIPRHLRGLQTSGDHLTFFARFTRDLAAPMKFAVALCIDDPTDDRVFPISTTTAQLCAAIVLGVVTLSVQCSENPQFPVWFAVVR